MAKTFELKVTDPDGIVYETDKAISLIIPSAGGFMGILADHAPVIAELQLGVATLLEEGKEPLRIVVSGGFVEVLDNTVMMLAEAAEREDEIDTERAERAKEHALNAYSKAGENKAQIDKLIRKYGYKGTPHTLEATEANKDLKDNLSASAHLIHGSSEGRFRITYCPGPGMSKEEIESVGFEFGNLDEMLKRYPENKMKDGWNIMPDGEEVYYISNPALGLWAYPSRFN